MVAKRLKRQHLLPICTSQKSEKTHPCRNQDKCAKKAELEKVMFIFYVPDLNLNMIMR